MYSIPASSEPAAPRAIHAPRIGRCQARPSWLYAISMSIVCCSTRVSEKSDAKIVEPMLGQVVKLLVPWFFGVRRHNEFRSLQVSPSLLVRLVITRTMNGALSCAMYRPVAGELKTGNTLYMENPPPGRE
jgi:hypothetical protein